MEKVKTEQELTPEEMEARMDEMKNYYEKQSEFLRIQLEFENLAAGIEEARLRRFASIVRLAELQTKQEDVKKPDKS